MLKNLLVYLLIIFFVFGCGKPDDKKSLSFTKKNTQSPEVFAFSKQSFKNRTLFLKQKYSSGCVNALFDNDDYNDKFLRRDDILDYGNGILDYYFNVYKDNFCLESIAKLDMEYSSQKCKTTDGKTWKGPLKEYSENTGIECGSSNYSTFRFDDDVLYFGSKKIQVSQYDNGIIQIKVFFNNKNLRSENADFPLKNIEIRDEDKTKYDKIFTEYSYNFNIGCEECSNFDFKSIKNKFFLLTQKVGDNVISDNNYIKFNLSMIWENKNDDIGKEEGVIGQTQTTWKEFAQAYNEKKDHSCGELKPNNTPLILKVSCLNKSDPIAELKKLYEISLEYHDILDKKYSEK